MKLYSYKIMWTLKDTLDKVNFKIVTDTLEGIKSTIDIVKGINGLDKCCLEYLNEYDVSKIGLVLTLDEFEKPDEVLECDSEVVENETV